MSLLKAYFLLHVPIDQLNFRIIQVMFCFISDRIVQEWRHSDNMRLNILIRFPRQEYIRSKWYFRILSYTVFGIYSNLAITIVGFHNQLFRASCGLSKLAFSSTGNALDWKQQARIQTLDQKKYQIHCKN